MCAPSQYKPAAPFRVIYKPAPLAAGKNLAITVEFQADQAGDHVSEIMVRRSGIAHQHSLSSCATRSHALQALAQRPSARLGTLDTEEELATCGRTALDVSRRLY